MTAPTISGRVGPERLDLDAARVRIVQGLAPLAAVASEPLRRCAGRVLAEDVHAPAPVPGFAASAMDGYAVRFADLDPDRPVALELAGRSLAGHPYQGDLAAGQCVRVTTGAALPRGADTVVMQERAALEGGRVRIAGADRRGQHVRAPDSDIAAGTRILAAGRRLTPVDLGLLASVGRNRVPVRRMPVVGYFTTGDELKTPGEALAYGEIYERSAFALGGMAERLGVEWRDFGIVPDHPYRVRETLSAAALEADLVLTTGGVSTSEADHMRDAVAALGEVSALRVAVEPGGPLAVGRLGDSVYLGLPGNPVSAVVAFDLFARPVLERLAGARSQAPRTFPARCVEPLRKRPGRRAYQRGILARDGAGAWTVRSAGSQDAASYSTLARANCYIVLAEEAGGAEAGSWVEVLPFET